MKKIFREYKTDKIQHQLDKRDRAQNLWPHHPDKLLISSVEYCVKYYGSVGVSASQGDSVIKSAIQHLTYQRNIGNSQAGTSKPPRVYLNISADKIAIRESKLKVELDRFDISEISYVADDRAVKRLVALIVAKKLNNASPNNNSFNELDKNAKAPSPFKCYLFESEKFAEEIVRTIGQAFDLGYRNFLSSDKREMQIKNQMNLMLQKIKYLENLNEQYCDRVNVLESLLKTNKIPYPKSSIPLKDTSQNKKCTPGFESDQKNCATADAANPDSRGFQLLQLEDSGLPQKEDQHRNVHCKMEQTVSIPSLKPPPLPAKSRPQSNAVAISNNHSSSTAVHNSNNLLLDLGDIPKTEENVYTDFNLESLVIPSPVTGQDPGSEEEWNRLTNARINKTFEANNGSHFGDNNYSNSYHVNDQQTPITNVDNSTFHVYSTPDPNFKMHDVDKTHGLNPFDYVSPDAAPNGYQQTVENVQSTTTSPNMPDLMSGLYFNAAAEDNVGGGDVNSLVDINSLPPDALNLLNMGTHTTAPTTTSSNNTDPTVADTNWSSSQGPFF